MGEGNGFGNMFFSVWDEDKQEYSDPIPIGEVNPITFSVPFVEELFYSPIDLKAVLTQIVKEINDERSDE